MPGPQRDRRAAPAVARYRAGETRDEIAADLEVAPSTVTRWAGDEARRRGPRERADVDTGDIVRMRDRDGMSWRAISREAGMSVGGVRRRYAGSPGRNAASR